MKLQQVINLDDINKIGIYPIKKEIDRYKYCLSEELFIEIQGNGIRRGLYCSRCGKWLKWINKQELKVNKIKE